MFFRTFPPGQAALCAQSAPGASPSSTATVRELAFEDCRLPHHSENEQSGTPKLLCIPSRRVFARPRHSVHSPPMLRGLCGAMNPTRSTLPFTRTKTIERTSGKWPSAQVNLGFTFATTLRQLAGVVKRRIFVTWSSAPFSKAEASYPTHNTSPTTHNTTKAIDDGPSARTRFPREADRDLCAQSPVPASRTRRLRSVRRRHPAGGEA